MTVTTATALWQMSAMELAEAIRSKETSSKEMIKSHHSRIQAVNTVINADVIIMGDEATEAAKGADRVVAEGEGLPPFHGIDVLAAGIRNELKELQSVYQSSPNRMVTSKERITR